MGNRKKGAGKERRGTKLAQDLVKAAFGGDLDELRALLASGADVAAQDAQGNHALGAAACAGHAPLIDALLEAGAPLELANDIGTTPLWLAAGYGHSEVGFGFGFETPACGGRVVRSALSRASASATAVTAARDRAAAARSVPERGARVRSVGPQAHSLPAPLGRAPRRPLSLRCSRR